MSFSIIVARIDTSSCSIEVRSILRRVTNLDALAALLLILDALVRIEVVRIVY